MPDADYPEPDLHVLYLEGDPCAPKFVEGALLHAGVSWNRPEQPSAGLVRRAEVVLLSDWPAARLDRGVQEAMVEAVAGGTGLVMVGGWTSLGRGGYAGTPLAGALPVDLHDGDDRRAHVQGAYPRARLPDHPLLAGIDLRRPPVLCGHNRVTAREGAEVVLDVAPVRFEDGEARLGPGEDLLVAGRHGEGRTLVLATDPAPHWSGGLTDWGDRMLPAPQDEEVGDHYVRLVGNLLRWAAGREP